MSLQQFRNKGKFANTRRNHSPAGFTTPPRQETTMKQLNTGNQLAH